MPNVTFFCDKREFRELRRSAKRRGLAVATVARVLALRHFDVEPSVRRATGPKTQATSKWLASRGLRTR